MFNNKNKAVKKYLNGEIPFKSIINEIYKEFERYINNKVKEKIENDFNS